MVDLPQHAAQISALQQIRADSPLFTDVFEINWFTPYLVGYLFAYAFAMVFSVSVAFKLVITVSLISIPLVSAILFREIGADERWKWLTIPSVFGIAFYWGLLNFIVAVPFGLLFLVLTVRFNRNPDVRNTLVIVGYSIFLFFCHILVLGYTSLLALAYLAGANYRDIRTTVLRFLPYTAPLPLIGVWLVLTHGNEATSRRVMLNFGDGSERLEVILRQLSGSQVSLDGFSSIHLDVVLGILLAVYPLLIGARFNKDPARWLPFVTGAAVFLIFPADAFGTNLLYHRFAVFLLPLWFIAFDPPAGSRARQQDWLAVSVVVLCALINVFRFHSFGRDAQGFDDLASLMAPGKKVLSMMVDNQHPYFSYPVFMHYGSWYQVSGNGIVDFNFAYFFPEMVRYKSGKRPKVTAGFGNFPTRFRWDKHGGETYDYFIVHAAEDMKDRLFKEHRDAIILKARSGNWWLYGRDG
jgi:hypothetical protein